MYGIKWWFGEGPEVWPRLISFDKAELTAVGFARVEAKLRGRVLVVGPEKPMSKPKLNPFIRYWAMCCEG